MTLPPQVLAFQKSFAEKHPEFIHAAHQLTQTCNEILADETGPPLNEPQVVCRCLTQTVANSFIAMNILVSQGYGCDALKIVRSMFETSVILASFDHFPALIQDFIDFRWIKKMKSIRGAKGTPREALISPQLEQEIEKNYGAVLHRFSDKNGKPLPSWYRGSLLDMCNKLDEVSVKMPWAAASYSDLYRFSSELMHGDIVGLESQLDSSGYNAEMPPCHNYVKESILSGHWVMVMTLASYASIAALPKAQAYGDQLLKGWEEVWGQGSRELEEAKNDPALPCAE